MKLSSAHKAQLAKVTRVALAGAMVVGSVGQAIVAPASAAALNANTTTISSSRTSNSSTTYTIAFTPPASSTTAISQVSVKFCQEADEFTATCTAPTAMDLAADLSTATAAGFAGSAGATTGTFTRQSANSFNFTVTTPAAESNISHTMVLGGLVTNSSAPGTYYTRVQTYSDAGTSTIDSGTSAYAIVNSTVVSGRVLETMTFTVGAVANGVACGSGGENATVTSTTTAVPFGNFATGTPRVGCQTVSTATNAVSGYTTTIKEVLGGASPQGGMCRQTATNCAAEGGQAGVSAANVIVDAVLNTTPAAWTNSTTFGLGLNANGTQAHSQYGGVSQYRSMFGATPISVATFTGPTTAVNTHVVLKADVPPTQTAGVYQNRVEYVTTPTF